MFILTMSCFLSPYLASKSSSKMASSKVLEQSKPMFNANFLVILPALREPMIGGTELWQLIPTSASLVRPISTACG